MYLLSIQCNLNDFFEQIICRVLLVMCSPGTGVLGHSALVQFSGFSWVENKSNSVVI